MLRLGRASRVSNHRGDQVDRRGAPTTPPARERDAVSVVRDDLVGDGGEVGLRGENDARHGRDAPHGDRIQLQDPFDVVALHLDGDPLRRALELGLVDLAQGRGRDGRRTRIQSVEEVLGPSAELRLDHAHRVGTAQRVRHVVLQQRQLLAELRREHVSTRAQRLPNLHERRAQPARREGTTGSRRRLKRGVRETPWTKRPDEGLAHLHTSDRHVHVPHLSELYGPKLQNDPRHAHTHSRVRRRGRRLRKRRTLHQRMSPVPRRRRTPALATQHAATEHHLLHSEAIVKSHVPRQVRLSCK